MSRWRAGDPSAGLRLLRPQVEPTRRYLSRHVRCPADVDDLLQRSLLASIEALPRYRQRVGVSRFVRAMATKLLLRHRRDDRRARARRDLEAAGRLDAMVHHGPSALARVSQQQGLVGRQQALTTLPRRSAELLRLRYWDEHDAAEIGQRLGLSPTAVRVRLHRARRELRRALVDMAGPAASDSDVWPIDGL
ncbi:MAG: sigma-70 family RNA polymerase sigma factor [Nannocystaceae bacterium]